MMTSENKAKWLAALRSGEYVQYRGCSNNDLNDGIPTARCCINVGAHAILGDDANKMPTHVSAINIGIDRKDSYDLIEMNDRKFLNFLEIADWIEENVESK